MDDDNALGEFLRARRNEVSPAAAGLPVTGDRRVPGLRREEVALLAGLSTDYYTRLEQGRELHPSEQVVTAVSRALLLDRHGAEYLYRLTQPAPRATAIAASDVVSDQLIDFVERGIGTPAVVLGPALDVLAANSLARALYGGFARFDNVLRMIFLDPVAREFYADWDHAARGVVGNLRALSAPYRDDPRVIDVVGELTVRSPAFVTYWQRREVRPRVNEPKTLRHRHVGEMHLRYQGFAVADAPGQHLFVYTAEPGSASADGLTLLSRVAVPPGHPSVEITPIHDTAEENHP